MKACQQSTVSLCSGGARRLLVGSAGVVLVMLVTLMPAAGQDSRLTTIQREIERQRQRLGSLEVEERRDALMRLALLKTPEASRAATTALADRSETVRVSAAHAIIWLPAGEPATLLIPMFKDKSEFVRREVAFALGETRDRSAVSSLVNVLASDKKPSVRAAAAIALGHIADAAAVAALSQAVGDGTSKKRKGDEDEFIVRSAVRSLGQIRSSAAVPILISALTNEFNSIDTRREAADALGLIGDPAALSALEAAFRANADPYLSEAARHAILQINRAKTKGAGN